jgi:hypothetical protein
MNEPETAVQKMVDMLFQFAPTSIANVIKILKAAKKKYGDIPVAGFNGEGFHISVERSDKELQHLSTEFSFGPRVRLPDKTMTYRRKKNPDTKYIWFWD